MRVLIFVMVFALVGCEARVEMSSDSKPTKVDPSAVKFRPAAQTQKREVTFWYNAEKRCYLYEHLPNGLLDIDLPERVCLGLGMAKEQQ